MAENVACPIACGDCCSDCGRPCPHLTPSGCRFPRGVRPPGCSAFVCGVARAVLDGMIDATYGKYLRQWERDAERWRTDTSGWVPPLSVDKRIDGE